MEIQKLLKQKFGDSQIGGKGTIRRKKKFTGHKLVHKTTEDGTKYNNRVNTINELVQKLNEISKTSEKDELYPQIKEIYDSELDELANSIDKYDLLKKSKIDYKELKEDRLDWVKSYFLKDKGRPLLFKTNIYDSHIKHTFEIEFIKECIIDMLDKLYAKLVHF
tara:strand:+ start:1978 stop:2469 length:492 start_codon:yes stop_codon:yes gene_type:complete